MDIRNVYDAVIFTSAALTLREALMEAIGKRANLSRADLSGANLYRADLSRADLYGANLSGANLSGAGNSEAALAQLQFIPTEGAFIGWKKCRKGVIVKLQITETAKRSHGAERKARASEVLVVDVFGGEFGVSSYDENFVYRKGETLTPANGWNEDRWVVCGEGIHFFITREEAEAYEL